VQHIKALLTVQGNEGMCNAPLTARKDEIAIKQSLMLSCAVVGCAHINNAILCRF